VAAANDLRSGVTQHPAVIAKQGERARSLQPLIADAITAYAGSVAFVYVHAVGFAVWMLFIESNPWPKLTLIVSLGAILRHDRSEPPGRGSSRPRRIMASTRWSWNSSPTRS
jgi:hypothetical protein